VDGNGGENHGQSATGMRKVGANTPGVVAAQENNLLRYSHFAAQTVPGHQLQATVDLLVWGA
jgi:hypothetical protein